MVQVEIYLRGVRIRRDYEGEAPPRGLRSEISSFTPGSKRRLKWAAANAYPRLVSTFGMTYHQTNPGGRECKRHLHAFLVALRRAYPGVGYLWILEFQQRKVAHFHIWLTIPHDTPGLSSCLGDAWHRIAEPGNEFHRWFHHRPENLIAWDMGSGGYLCKYLDKVHQKIIPKGFTGIGRFWGASRGLVPTPAILDSEDIPEPVIFVRTICKHHEAALRRTGSRKKFHHRARRSPCSYRLPNAAEVAWQLLGSQSPPSLQTAPARPLVALAGVQEDFACSTIPNMGGSPHEEEFGWRTPQAVDDRDTDQDPQGRAAASE